MLNLLILLLGLLVLGASLALGVALPVARTAAEARSRRITDRDGVPVVARRHVAGATASPAP